MNGFPLQFGKVFRCSRWTSVVPVFLGLVLFTSGCGDRPRTPTLLQPKAQFYAIDVPVPRNFDLDRRRSTHDYRGGKRTIKHYYSGREDPQAVANFYRQEMAKYEWELEDQHLKTGVDYLNFRKGEETCQIRIEKTPGGWFGSKTQVCASVEPS